MIKRIVTNNKKASFEYFLEQKIEAGIVLIGSEVKSLRLGKANIEDAYGVISDDELYLHNSYIAEYKQSNRFNHNSRRPRKLLLHKTEIKKIIGKIKIKGYTLVPTSLYFNNRNLAKVEIALAKGKKLYDKRQDLKDKTWKREQARLGKRL